MAGIVAQITKANWERKQRSRRFLPPDKSVYFIPPFDPAFDPKRHNVFIRRKTNFEEMHKRVKCRSTKQKSQSQVHALNKDEELKVLRDIMDELARVTEEENRMLNPEPIGLQVM